MSDSTVPACDRCAKPITLKRGPAYASARNFCSPACQYARGPEHLSARFWSKVDKRGPDECWPWLAALDRKGYGKLGVDGKTRTASRVAYELATGNVGDSHVLHACDNPPCCNPAHLFLGTHADNVRDMDAKGRRVVGGICGHYRLRRLLDQRA